MTNKQAEKLLKLAEEKGLFKDLVCPKCESVNKIDYKECKIDRSGIWYSCNKCKWLDVIGWDIVKEIAEQN